MTKYSLELKLKAVLAYLEGVDSFRTVANQFNTKLSPFSYGNGNYFTHSNLDHQVPFSFFKPKHIG
ncbi:hypothetical protein [Peribacillus sp. NPDC096540]|uniref:hypothetical protein n=1 Tax=Peribacillus sp. NPDC096540 TaxID=3390612 RepID=UPI003CFE8E20